MSSKSSFERPRNLRVHWDDDPEHELHGAVIFMKRLSIDALRELSTLDVPDDDEEVDAGQLDLLVDRLAGGLISWNLAEGGEPRPAVRDELVSDANLCLAILGKWMAVAGSTSGPLDRRSTNGSRSPGVSALTDLQSESL